MSAPELSIIIVNYNTGKLLARCLKSIQAHVRTPYQVIVVDNNSHDGSLENLPALPDLTLLRESTNWGFARACNIGARQAKGAVLHFLNPDTEVGQDIDGAYQKAAAIPGLYSTTIVDSTGQQVKVNFAFPTFANLARILTRRRPHCWYIGASLLIRADLFQSLGGFSEDYALYAEDEDLFYKAYLAGVNTGQLAAQVIHHQGTSSMAVWSAYQRLLRVESSGWIFARKFHLSLSYFVFRHLGFARGFWCDPKHTGLEFLAFWRVLLIGGKHPLPGNNAPS